MRSLLKLKVQPKIAWSLIAITLSYVAYELVTAINRIGNPSLHCKDDIIINVRPVSWFSARQTVKIKSPPSKPKANARWTNSVGIEFCWVPEGRFWMGKRQSHTEVVEDDERPMHLVEISKGFWISKYEVSQVQWLSVMAKNLSWKKGKNLPVHSLSWCDCQDYIRKLNVREGHGNYRLPTEAEWEYACSTPIYDHANRRYEKLVFFEEEDGTKPRLVPVEDGIPNQRGLYHMLGNVNEWCHDWYADDYYSKSPKVDPRGAASGTNRVIRGGNAFVDDTERRLGYRNADEPKHRGTYYGLRLVMDNW